MAERVANVTVINNDAFNFHGVNTSFGTRGAEPLAHTSLMLVRGYGVTMS